jgi:hypothetical protein
MRFSERRAETLSSYAERKHPRSWHLCRLQNYELILTEQKKMVEKSVSVLKHIKNGWHK